MLIEDDKLKFTLGLSSESGDYNMTFKQICSLAFGATAMAIAGCSTLEACQTPECAADAKITADVRGHLHAMPSLAGGNVSVQTSHGIVYLYGVVDTNFERNLAEEAASRSGAKEVYNDISISN